MRVAEFLSDNYPLEPIARFEDDDDESFDKMYFLLSEIDEKNNDERIPYTYYIYEAIMLLGTLC